MKNLSSFKLSKITIFCYFWPRMASEVGLRSRPQVTEQVVTCVQTSKNDSFYDFLPLEIAHIS